MGDGEAFQQLLEGRIERHPLRETSVPKKRMVVDSREICERKKEERKEEETVVEKGKESWKSVKIEGKGEGWDSREVRAEHKQGGRLEKEDNSEKRRRRRGRARVDSF